jgi:pimeloyl-ACP methyl ester carboxylesterase
VATDDKMIPPDAQRAMSKRAGAMVTETKGSHAVYVSRPDAVVSIIDQAARHLRASLSRGWGHWRQARRQ